MGAGEGHDWEEEGCTNPTWCDLCGELIWGLYDTGPFRYRGSEIIKIIILTSIVETRYVPLRSEVLLKNYFILN